MVEEISKSDYLRIYQKEYYKKNREKSIEYAKEYYNKNKEKLLNNHARKRYRIELLEILGNKCCKCGFSDPRALQFDHKDDDGYLDRKLLKSDHGILQYYYHNQDKAKQKLQILCANCNWIKRYEVKKHNQH